MEIIISEEELRGLLKSLAKVAVNETDPIIEDFIFSLKLSKQPVEVVAEGKVEYNKIDDLYMIGDDFEFIIFSGDKGEKYNNKNIKIYIEKGKE